MRIFTKDPEVIAVGVEYLRIVVLNFVASGITFVSRSMFQALGNTIPSLVTSGLRLVVAVDPGDLPRARQRFPPDVDLVSERVLGAPADDGQPAVAAA